MHAKVFPNINGIALALLLLALLCAQVACQRKDPTVPTTGNAEPAASDGTGKPAEPQKDPPVSSMWKPEYQASLDRGLKWLLDNQHKDGRWGHFLPERPNDIYTGGVNSLKAFGSASSAICSMALLMQPESEEVNAALLKGYGYLIKSPDTRRVTGTTFYNIWSHSYMLQAISLGLMDERLKSLHVDLKKRGEHELKRLLSLQSLDGGFGYYDFKYKTYRPSGQISTSFGAATALVAMKEARKAGFEVPEKHIKVGLDYIVRMRFPNGAYAYSTGHRFYPQGSANRIRGSLGRSQACNNALKIWDRLPTEDLKKGFDNFFKEHQFIEMGRCRQYPHESWYATAPYYYYYGHFYASCNLELLPDSVQKDFADKLAALIVLTQFDDGSFWDYPLFGYTRAYGTGFGVLILSNCKRNLSE